MLSLLLAIALVPTIPPIGGLESPSTRIEHRSDSIPADALEALKQGRYWRASKILRSYLAVAPDTSPESILLIARAEAGWGDWPAVERLLAGRSWLDTAEDGAGWGLLGRSRIALGRWSDGEYALARYLELAPGVGDRERGLAEARRGRALLAGGSPAEAVEAFERAAALLPQIGDWLNIFGAEAAAAAGDTATVTRLLARVDSGLALGWGWRIRMNGRIKVEDFEGAQRVAESAANSLGEASRRTEAWWHAGRLRLWRGDTTGAREAYRRAIAAAPQTVPALDAARGLLELGEVTPEDQLRVGRLYIRHGNLDRGLAGLRAYLDAGRGTPLERAALQLEIGRALFSGARYPEAERHLLALVGTAPTPRIAADALFLAARSQYRQRQIQKARATLLQLTERFPQQGAAAKAYYLLADLDHDRGDLASARELYRRAAAGLPAVPETGLASMRLGGLAFLEGDFEGAVRIFEDYRERQPNGRRIDQATYWAGRAYQELGRQVEAVARFREVRRRNPFSWYGLRAAEHLGEDILAVPMEPEPARNEKIAARIETAFERLDLLRELDLQDVVDFEIGRLRRHFAEIDGASYALAEAFNERGYTLTGIRLGWEIHRREKAWNPRLLRIIYPFPYRDMIIAEARERGLDPFFVAGLIRQESTFSATIKSPVGAVGLMQIMPATGRHLAQTAGIPDFEPSLLERPELNLHLGMRYLTELLDRFQARPAVALAAYNAGPHRLKLWSTFPEYRDDDLFAERIPFTETREYVKIVQQNARIYAVLYADTEGEFGASGN